MSYATTTSVSPGRSREEIERLLARYGADQFAYGWDADRAVVMFRMRGRHIRFTLPMPDRSDRQIAHTPTGRKRAAGEAEKALEQAQRARWRSLVLIVKAKLEAVESGVTTFEDEWLAYIVLPDGLTVGTAIGTGVADAYRTGQMPSLNLALGPGAR